jgi:hypothetical protein
MQAVQTAATVLLLLGCVSASEGAKKVRCPGGDVQCLVGAVEEANISGDEIIVQLAAGEYLLDAHHPEVNGYGLAITGHVTLKGAGAGLTIIGPTEIVPIGAPSSTSPFFTLIQNLGTLSIEGVSLLGRHVSPTTGIMNGGVLNVTDSIIGGMDAALNWKAGHAINIATIDAPITITRSLITGNRGSGTGAGINQGGGRLDIIDSVISDNIGGALLAGNGTANIVRSTLSGNSASDGGAIYITGGTTVVNIVDSAIVTNTAGIGGAVSIHVYTPDSVELTITNSTLAGNTATTGSGGAIQVAETDGTWRSRITLVMYCRTKIGQRVDGNQAAVLTANA